MRALLIIATVFTLAGPAAAQEGAAPVARTDAERDPDAVRCRKIQVTGSLVKKERICKTNAEWSRKGDQMNRDADDFITRSRTGLNPNG